MTERKIEANCDAFILTYPNADARAIIPVLKHYFPAKKYHAEPFPHWKIPAQPAAVAKLRNFQREHSFTLTPAAESLLSSLIAPVEQAPAPKQTIDRRMTIGQNRKGFQACHIWTRELVPAVYQIVSKLDGGEFVNQPKKGWAIPFKNAEALLKLAEEYSFDLAPEARSRLEQEIVARKEAERRSIRGKAALIEAARDISTGSFGGKTPRVYQVAGVSFILDAGRALLGDDMGCISGDTVLRINRNSVGRRMTIRELHLKWHGIIGKWQKGRPVTVKSMFDGGDLRHNEIIDVVFQGIKSTFELRTESGKVIRATGDHEFATPEGWRSLDSLSAGDVLLTNGLAACVDCGSTEKVSTYYRAKFRGFCRKCIYRKYRKNANYKRGWLVDGDGYIRVSGQQEHPRCGKMGAVYKQILVMEEAIGRYVTLDEIVHHKNEIKTDNRLENLELLTKREHALKHSPEKMKHLKRDRHGNEIVWTAREDRIVSIVPYGEEAVYDLVMSEPARNFVANGIIVHNCGKTLQALLYARSFQRAFSAGVITICPVSLKAAWAQDAEACGVEMSIHSAGKIPDPPNRPFVLLAEEAHMYQNLQSLRTQAMLKLALSPNCIGALMISGTPTRGGRPANIYPLLKAIRHPLGKSWKTFTDLYCPGGPTSADPEKLAALMKAIAPVFLRRTKEQVLPDLPAKSLQVKTVEVADQDRATYKEMHAKGRAEYKAAVEARKITGEKLGGGEILVLLGKLRQAASLAKVAPAIEMADEILEQGRKIVLFTEFVESAKKIAAYYQERKIAAELLTGQAKDRGAMVERFQKGNSRVWVSTIKAGGVGLTLTAASDVILIDQAWMWDDNAQAGDRCHRLGAKSAVMIYWLRAFEIDRKLQERNFEQKAALDAGMKAGKPVPQKTLAQMAAEVARELFEI